jgi:hypothetical protein
MKEKINMKYAKSVLDRLFMTSTSAVFILMVLFLTHMTLSNGEAALNAEEPNTTNDRADEKHSSREGSVELEKMNEHDWNTRFSSEGLSRSPHQEDVFQRQLPSRLRLKSPGKLPGIELGVELHSLQAFQSVVPSEGLIKEFDLKQEQPLLLPPSINVPDYNGGFLRFTW